MADAVPVDLIDTPQAGPSVIRGGFLRLGSYVLGTLASVIAGAIVIRHLGVTDTGRYSTVMALVVIVGSISDLGLSAVGVREYTMSPRETGRRFLRNLLGIRLAFLAIGIAFAVAFAVVANYTTTMVVGTCFAGIGMALYVIQQSVAIPLHATLRFGWVAGLAFLFQAGIALGAAVLALVGARLLPFLCLWAPVMVLVLALTLAIGGPDSRLLPSFDTARWRSMVRQILPYSIGVVLSVLYFRIGQVMVSVISSPQQTGYFGVAFRMLDALTTIPPLLVSTALPVLARAARDDADRFAYTGRRLVEAMLLGGVGLALAAVPGARFAVELVAGPGFGPSIHVLQVLAIALLGTFVIAARGYALLSLGRMRAMMISNAIALSVVGGAGIPLVYAHGAIGAAIAMTVAELTLATCYEIALTRGRPELRPSPGFIVRVAGAATMAAVPVLLLDVSSAVKALIAVTIYGAALLGLGAVPAELLQAVRPRTEAP